tara:strand:- start:709 stop:1071 length:363 start_codon:yes stop_codon:yes gene_type:complete
MPANQPHDYTTHGMTEREMKKRIKSHYAMAAKAFEKYENNKVPAAFFNDSYKTWAKNNPTSPWFNKGGGYDQMEQQSHRAYDAKKRATQRLATGRKLVDKLAYDKANNLQKSIKKLTQGK